MTISQMHQSFELGLDKVASLNYPNFIGTEIDLLLNEAQDRYVKQRYGLTNIKRQSFEETQKRTDDLKELVLNATISPEAVSADSKPNARFYLLPSTTGIEYWFAVNEECNITYVDCHGENVTQRVPIKAIQHNEYNKIIKDPFNKPDKNEVIRLMYNGQTELIAGDSTQTLGNYYLRYIKKPIRVVLSPAVDCELSEHSHSEIVALAVSIALENIEAKRNQTFDKILNTQE